MGLWKRRWLKLGLCSALVSALVGAVAISNPLSLKYTVKAEAMNYKSEMINLIQEMRVYTRQKNAKFALMGNNGLALFLVGENHSAKEVQRMIESVDGIIMEEFHYGWEMKDDSKTPGHVQTEIMEYLKLPMQKGLAVLNIDYCTSPSKLRKSYVLNEERHFVGFAADSRQLDNIPKYPRPIYHENARVIATLREAENFLVLLNPEHFRNKQDYVDALRQTNYDLLIIDLTFNGEPLTKEEIAALKVKANGAKRLVFSYVSVGEAEDYRSYWQPSWHDKMPSWVAEENQHWEGNYKVKYWTKEWKRLLFGGPDAYMDQVVDHGFDGAFLDVIDAFVYFEELKS